MDKSIESSSEIISEIKWSKTMQLHWNYRVYIPSGYKTDIEKRYSVLYFLHGWGGNVTNTSDETRIDSKKILDKLINDGDISPMIIVFIDGFNSCYVDGPTFKMKSAIIKDLIPFIDSEYRTINDKKSRSIAGISMGGFGALNIGLSNPDMFNSIGLISPAIWDEIEEGNPIYDSPLIEIYYENFYKKLLNDLKDRDLSIFAYHGKDDEIINYKYINNFVKFMKDKGFNINYELDEVGPHNWETWRRIYPKVLKDINQVFDK